VRGYEKAGKCSFFNKVNLLLMIKRAQLIWKSCFTTGASKRPIGVNAPIVIWSKMPGIYRLFKLYFSRNYLFVGKSKIRSPSSLFFNLIN
jgi:hypothetical protein